MRSFYRLLNSQLSELIRGVLLLCAGHIIATWLLVRQQVKDYSMYSVQDRFEDIYYASGTPIVFLLSLLGVLALFIVSFYRAYWRSKSIYTLLTLPVKREVLYFSKLCSLAISVVMLLSAQLAGFVLAYRYVEQKVASYDNGQFEMTSGLFLAFIRSDVMRLLWPYGSLNLLSTISIFLAIIIGVYYVVLCERSKRKWGWVMLVILLWLIVTVIQMRLDPIYNYESLKIILNSALLLTLSTVSVWHSIYLLKKGAIA